MFKIVVPATSANMGAGFDCQGVALNLFNEFEFDESDKVDIKSYDNLDIPTDESNLVYRTVNYVLNLHGKTLGGLYLRQRNNIPIACGLGSSSTCIVAGLLAANKFMGDVLSPEKICDMAVALEGHPDNVMPALRGGFTVSTVERGKVYYAKQEIDDDINFIIMAPDFEFKTEFSRSVLPKNTTLKDSVYNISRAALTSMAFAQKKYELLNVSINDVLHEQFRLPFISGADEILSLAKSGGALAVYLSGAGPSIAAIVTKEQTAKFCEKMQHAVKEVSTLSHYKIIALKVHNEALV